MKRYDPESKGTKASRTINLGVPSVNVRIDECIYCGAGNVPLSKEHTIPYGLWGRNVLEKASCEKCSEATSRFETHVLKETLGRAREVLDAPTRHAKKRAERTGRIIIEDDAGNKMDVPLHIMPQFILLPGFDHLPRAICGNMKARKHKTFSAFVAAITNRQDPIVSGRRSNIGNINSKPWARFIAKTVYGEYIRQHNSEFRAGKRLRNFITRGFGDETWFVGGRLSPPSVNALYKIAFSALARRDGSHALVGYLRLFALFETPSYLVYLGEIPADDELPPNLERNGKWTPNTLWPNYAQDEIIEPRPLT